MGNLNGVFGMSEMEQAAELILEKCKMAGTWATPTVYVDMKNDAQQAGFLQLIYCECLRPAYYKHPFYPTQRFVDLVRSRSKYDLGSLPEKVPNSTELCLLQTRF